MRQTLLVATMTATLVNSHQVFADSETETIKHQLDALKKDYEQRMQTLEARLKKIEQQQKNAEPEAQKVATESEQNNESSITSALPSFNPDISLILDGQYAYYSNDTQNYRLPGFMLGAEAGLGNKGFALGESELTISSNIDDKFFGQLTLAFSGDADNTEVSVEEAFFQTLGLGYGLTLKGGRFFSAIGYLNEQHAHAWDFADAPLIYRGLFGDQLVNDGVQVTYLLPTDIFMQIGGELSAGDHFPAAGSQNGIGAWSLFFNIGDDIGIEHSWQLGVNYWQADSIKDRKSNFLDTTSLFNGDSKIASLDFVYKWAPNGNPINKNFKFQFEYFDRHEDGSIAANNINSNYDGHQYGWYAQGIFQFMPQWKIGVRYDQLESDNSGSNSAVLATTGLLNSFSPKRYSAMLEWIPSEFSRIRLQYNYDNSYQNSDSQLFVQYTYSLGTHGAHQY